MTTVASYGSWASPVTADLLVERMVSLSYPLLQGEATVWVEMRPSEGGRYTIVRRSPEGTVSEILPPEFAARTLVHEYGGLAYAVHGEVIFFSNFSDQRLYRIDAAGGPPEPITAEPPQPAAWRYADPAVSPDGRWLACVRERHTDEGVFNEIAALPTDGSAQPRVVAAGSDFYSSPRFSPGGDRLAWLSWDHPRMPWDGTELWEAVIDSEINPGEPRLVAGGPEESLSQPRYAPDGGLHYMSDRTGWWNIYLDDRGTARAVAPRDAEFSGPEWVFGQSSYVFLSDGTLVATWSEAGLDKLGVLGPGGKVVPVETGFTSLGSLQPAGSSVLAVAASAAEAPSVVRISIPERDFQVLRRSRDLALPPEIVSTPRAIEFPTEGELTAHALYYAPRNPDFVGPGDELPPLIVISHGGPTAATSSALNLGIQFWTSRGIGVVDVNYGGSTGYGREYRRRLVGMWGVVDVDDCTNAALYLADRGEADGSRLVIRGGSAGGYTTLCALTFRNVFACGGSHYGVADAGALAQDTHKFESRYLDSLIGPWPEARALYEKRSPIFHTDRLDTPLIIFQGLEDKVVPPSQAEMMVDALRAKGVPFAYIAYEGEQHGFRKAENIKRTAEAELYFYGRILGFTPADDLPPVEIENSQAIAQGR